MREDCRNKRRETIRKASGMYEKGEQKGEQGEDDYDFNSCRGGDKFGRAVFRQSGMGVQLSIWARHDAWESRYFHLQQYFWSLLWV